jgi:hypothetical protein
MEIYIWPHAPPAEDYELPIYARRGPGSIALAADFERSPNEI